MFYLHTFIFNHDQQLNCGTIEHAYGGDLATPLESEILRGHAQVQKDKENFVVLCLRPQLNVASGNFTS